MHADIIFICLLLFLAGFIAGMITAIFLLIWISHILGIRIVTRETDD